MKKTFVCIIAVTVLIAFLHSGVRAEKDEPLAGPQTLAKVKKLVEGSKIPFQQADSGVWVLSYTGGVKKDIKVIVVAADELLIYVVDLCDAKDLVVNGELYAKMIELSGRFDMVKFVFSSEGAPSVRLDSYMKTVDLEQFIKQADQIAKVADEAYSDLQKFMKKKE